MHGGLWRCAVHEQWLEVTCLNNHHYLLCLLLNLLNRVFVCAVGISSFLLLRDNYAIASTNAWRLVFCDCPLIVWYVDI